MSYRKAEYTIGQYAEGNGPGAGGMWFVERIVTERIAYGENRAEVENVADAFRAAEAQKAISR